MNDLTDAYSWSCVTSEVPWSPRDGAQLVSFQDKLFLLGGWNQYASDRPDLAGDGVGSFEADVCSEVWCSDDDGASWSLAATAPWSGRHMHGAVVHDDHIWIVGAESGTDDDVWKSKDGLKWELVQQSDPFAPFETPLDQPRFSLYTTDNPSYRPYPLIWIASRLAGSIEGTNQLAELERVKVDVTHDET